MKKFTRFMITIKHNGAEYPVTVTRKDRHFKLHLKRLIGYGSIPQEFQLCFCTAKSLDCRLKVYKKLKRKIFEEYSYRFKKSA